jgi:hypothetical protein
MLTTYTKSKMDGSRIKKLTVKKSRVEALRLIDKARRYLYEIDDLSYSEFTNAADSLYHKLYK